MQDQTLLLNRSPGNDDVLVVDLDALLVTSDLGFEAFWTALAQQPSSLVSPRDPARDAPSLDVTALPYNSEVLDALRQWRAGGGRIYLVAAADRPLAERIADHLEVFDGTFGADGNRPLSGTEKASLLADRFGERGFAFIGRTATDVPVWQKARHAISVDASRSLRSELDALGTEAQHLATAHGFSLRSYLAAMRPHQWLKNCLVFVPILAAHQITAEAIWSSLLAFVAFSLTASGVYILNDLLDLAADRAHPRKCRRPLASGRLRVAHGTWLAPLLLLGGLAFELPLGGNFIIVLVAYFAATTLYSLYLKRRMLIDICTLAGLYTLRIVAGGVATGIPLSVWLLAFSMFIFFSLAAVKRQAELVDSVAAGKEQTSGRGYLAGDLPLIAGMATASGYVSVLVLALYVNSPDVLELYSSPSALWGICAVLLYWISRMVMVTHRGNMHDDPLVYAVRDPVSRFCLLLVLAFAIGGTMI